MKETQTTPFSDPFEAVSQMWMSAWLQPWSAWQRWAELWSAPWRQWVDSVALAPAVGLPAALGGERTPGALADLLAPWLPRVEAWVKPLAGYPGGEAMRLMLKAALPLAAAGAGEWLTVDAVVAKRRPEGSQAARTLTAEALPAVSAAVAPIEAKVAAPAAEDPTPRQPAPAAAATQALAKRTQASAATPRGGAETKKAPRSAAAPASATASAGAVRPAAAEPKGATAAAPASPAPRARRKPKAAPGGKGGATPAA